MVAMVTVGGDGNGDDELETKLKGVGDDESLPSLECLLPEQSIYAHASFVGVVIVEQLP